MIKGAINLSFVLAALHFNVIKTEKTLHVLDVRGKRWKHRKWEDHKRRKIPLGDVCLQASFRRNYNVSPFASAQTQHRRALQTYREVERKNPRRETGRRILRKKWTNDRSWGRESTGGRPLESAAFLETRRGRRRNSRTTIRGRARVTSVKGFDVYRAATPALAFSNGPVRGTFT